MHLDWQFFLTIGAVIGSVWAGLRFVLEPRLKLAIDERVEAKAKGIVEDLEEMRHDVERNKEQLLVVPHTLASLDKTMRDLTDAVRTLTHQQTRQGEAQAEMRGEMRGAIERMERRETDRRQHYTDPGGLGHPERRRAERRGADDPGG